MQKKTLTLKSLSRTPEPSLGVAYTSPTCVVAGRLSKRPDPNSCPAVIERLHQLVKDRREVFIQMRHGAGYCGVPVLLEDGWLTLNQASVHGSKQTAAVDSVLIQIRDGSFIAHVHAAKPQPTKE